MPPPGNGVTMDHGLDEDHIWAFGLTLYNQYNVSNKYTNPMAKEIFRSHAPWWGEKLTQPAFYKREKVDTFNRQW